VHKVLALSVVAFASSAAAVDVPWNVFTFFFSFCVGVYTWLGKRQAVDRAIVNKLEKSVAVIEERIRHLPTAEQMSTLTVTIAAQTEQLKAVNGHLKGLERRTDLMQSFVESRG